MSKKTIITAVLALSTIGFLIGTIVFFRQDSINKKQRDNLLANGVRTEATVNSTDKKDIVEYNHYFGTGSGSGSSKSTTDYYITFTYFHDNVSRVINQEIKLSDYLDGKKPKTRQPKPKNRTRITTKARKDIYKTKMPGSTINIIYLFNDTKSARVLNKDGGVSIPGLFIFGIISLLLFISSAYMFYYFRKTGKTF